MPGGKLRRAETELVILHVAREMGCEYEWDHHVRLGKKAGLDDEAILKIQSGAIDGAPFSPRERALLGASRELLTQRVIGDEAWRALTAQASEEEVIELCLLVGHYQMLAMTLNTLRVQLDAR